MSETETETQGQKPKTCRLAIASLVLGLLGPFGYSFQEILVQHFYELWLSGLGRFTALCYGLAWIFGILCGFASLSQIKSAPKRLAGKMYAYMGIVISIFWMMLILCILPEPGRRVLYERVGRMVCTTNLSGLGKAMLIYANDYDEQYPTADKWCDLLMEYTDGNEQQFRCPRKRGERCSYAMNPNCEPNSPPDMVLLFETKGGWNQLGGPEILTTENHQGEGCNVLFNDIHVEFVRPEQISKLKWKDEQKQ